MLAELKLTSDRDDLYANQSRPTPFEFNAEVVRVFDDMVSRSIPLYREVMSASAQWTHDFYQPGSIIVDVGCSTGTFLELIGRSLLPLSAHLVGIDNSVPMIERAAEKLAPLQAHHRIELLCQNVRHATFTNCSVVVMNYTLQFLKPWERQKLLAEIYGGLLAGGLLFMSEKVRSVAPRLQEAVTRHYESFKEQNGYARTEIERKKEALENVLTPLTTDEQISMIRKAGFSQVDSLLKMHNFTTFVAIKDTQS